MTEMENDVKVVPFCDNKPLSSISTAGKQEVYYRNKIADDGGKNYRPLGSL